MTQRRKLAAILSADVVGYSRLMAANEAATVETLKTYRDIIARLVARHGGRVVNAPGDALLAEFPSAVESVQAAVEIQKSLEGHNIELESERRMQFRIGVNLGDVIEEADGTIYGDGVNIAARMEALAEAGSVCISSTVYDAVEGKLALGFDFLGEQQVKNIAKPVRVYRVRAEPRTTPARTGVWRRLGRRVRLPVIGAAALIVLVAAGALTWQVLQSRAPVEDPVLALPKGPSIAVLPFANLSGDPTQDYFADGITEEIITQLTRFRELFVLARNTTFQYKGQAVDIKKLGRELGVRYVLEGSIRKAAGTLRVSAQLLDATSGAHLWAETFDRPLTASNLFAVQDEITGYVVSRIADAYGGVIARARFEESTRKRTESLDSYDCLLQATRETVVADAQLHRRARDCLERATTLEPTFAEGWAALSWMYLCEYLFGLNPRPDPLDRALRAAQRAVTVDPAAQSGHGALALAHYHRREREQFIAQAEQALALNPSNAGILAEMGMRFSLSGQLERGVALTRKAMKLNPHHGDWYYIALMEGHFFKGEYEQALAEALKFINPSDFYWWHAHRAAIYGQLGRRKEAQAEIATVLTLYPDFAKKVRRELRIWQWDEREVEHWLDGYRKAGLEIPNED